MRWDEIRRRYPRQWLLVEAIVARTEEDRRLLEQMAVVDALPDARSAMRRYQELHRAAPERELYVLHTDRESLDIRERLWLGIRRSL
jgi:hypothetical protein